MLVSRIKQRIHLKSLWISFKFRKVVKSPVKWFPWKRQQHGYLLIIMVLRKNNKKSSFYFVIICSQQEMAMVQIQSNASCLEYVPT